MNALIQGVTLAQFNDVYLDEVKQGQSAKTYDEKLGAFHRFVENYGEDLRVDAIRPSMVLEYLQTQEAERSGNAANKDRKNLSAGWNWSKEFIEGWPLDTAHPNPFTVVPRRKEERSDRVVPSEEGFWAVYGVSEGQDRVILMAAYYLAARRGELWGLTWKDDVDLKDKRVRLKTNKTAGVKAKYTWLPMVDELYKALLWQWENVRTIAHDYVFWSQAENQHKGNRFRYRQKWMSKLCEAAEVASFGMHGIRHLRAIRLYTDGARLSSIQKWLRHDTPSTTEIYLKSFGLDLDDLLEVAEASSHSKAANFDSGTKR